MAALWLWNDPCKGWMELPRASQDTWVLVARPPPERGGERKEGGKGG